jgi:hypothetical protein
MPCSHRSKTAKIKRGRERDSGNSSSYEAYESCSVTDVTRDYARFEDLSMQL